MAKIPSWWLPVGTETAQRVEQVFKSLLSDLPMSQKELGAALNVDQSTVARWAHGKTVPDLPVMREAVEEIRKDLEQRLARARTTEEILQELSDVEEGPQPTSDLEKSRAVRELLDELESGEN